jgi:membrane protein implicated in regulation of membrane protease activity
VNALRIVALAIGLLCAGAGVTVYVRAPWAWPVALDFTAFGVLLVATTLLERRYRRTVAQRRSGFESTGERFIDPMTGDAVSVDYNPATGERSYRKS